MKKDKRKSNGQQTTTQKTRLCNTAPTKTGTGAFWCSGKVAVPDSSYPNLIFFNKENHLIFLAVPTTAVPTTHGKFTLQGLLINFCM